MNRILGGATKAVTKPWHMYPVGLLFGLGFDTATEVSLLVLAGGAAAFNLPWYALLVLPVLFAAGMSLLDSIDGCFMNFAYDWAFSKPVRKVYYNITVTGLSVAVALVIGGVELTGDPRRQAATSPRGRWPRWAASTSTTSATPSSGCSSSPGWSRSRCGATAASRRSGAPSWRRRPAPGRAARAEASGRAVRRSAAPPPLAGERRNDGEVSDKSPTGPRSAGRMSTDRSHPSHHRETSVPLAVAAHRRQVLAGLAVTLTAALVGTGPAHAHVVADAGAARLGSSPPPVRHVFVVNLENKGYLTAFGPKSPAPYLSRTLRSKGQLLTRYYGVAHNSLPNYIAQISGQGPNPATQADCHRYTAFRQTGTASPQQAVGRGCVYPRTVRTVAGQLRSHELRWRGYLEDMGTVCRHPRLGGLDHTRLARAGDQYAARHNPFVYFRGITRTPACRNDVPLSQLRTDLQRLRTTRNLSYVTPNLCNDGHDAPCVDGRAGGLVAADRWLSRWVPRILHSPAFRRNGLLVVTFDEAEGRDASACCHEGPTPNAALPGLTGPGGGRIGAVLVSPYVTAGSTNATPYNHYSLLRTVEDLFGLPYLGYAADASSFGSDVWAG